MKKTAKRLILKFGKLLLLVLPILAAAAVVAVLARTRTGPRELPVSEVGRALRVIEAPTVDLVPRAVGYGLAEPARIWRAVAQVPGELAWVSPRLQSGMLIEESERLAEISPADYELAVARSKAAIAEARARLGELAAEEENRRASLAIERESLALAVASLERMRVTLEAGDIPPDAVDREERNVLRQRQTIQEIENALGLIPARREAMQSSLAMHEVSLEQAKLDLARTVIKAPFACRLGEARLERGQFVSAGQVLFEGHGADAAEIEAMFRPEKLRTLLPPETPQPFEAGVSMEALREWFGFEATVRLRSGDWVAEWPARFDRIREQVDPRTRAIKIVAVVEDPFGLVVPGERPALARGMYCEMEIRAPVRPGTVVLPRSAVRGGRVHVVDDEGRLRTVQVQIAHSQDDFVVVESGLAGGETVVVSDPTPAIEGMKVEAIPDPELLRALVEQAEGRGARP